MACLSQWRQWLLPLVYSIYAILAFVALPLCVFELKSKDAPTHVVAWFVGGIFTIMAVPISLWGIINHIIHYTQPHMQRYIIRILWMAPIYGLNAWFALRFPDAAIYLDTLRECYEAYVIYNFMSYLLSYLSHEHPHLDIVLEGKDQVKHFIPFCFLKPWPMGEVFIQRCKHGVLQYAVVRPTTTVIALLCQIGGAYDEGDFNFTTAWSYLVIINNISQVWAMYNLILFYKATKQELLPIKPIPKFLCVKFVVFMSFWQSVLIAALVKLNVIPQDGTWEFYHDVKDVATGLQDFLICIEMFLAAIAHSFAFPHTPYISSETRSASCLSALLSMWDVRDVRDDVVEHVKVIGNTVIGKKAKRDNTKEERTPLLNGNSNNANRNRTSYHDDDELNTSLRSADWDASSLGKQESLGNQSVTASLVNYAEFESSVDKTNSVELKVGSSDLRTKKDPADSVAGDNHSGNVVLDITSTKDEGC